MLSTKIAAPAEQQADDDLDKLFEKLFGSKAVLKFMDLQAAGIVHDRATERRRRLKDGFPEPILLSANAVGWLRSDVLSWLKSRPRGLAPQPRRDKVPIRSKAPVTLPNLGVGSGRGTA